MALNVFTVAMLFSTFGFTIIGESYCFADLTFHSAAIASNGEPNPKNQNREVFPSPNGIEFFVTRSAALRIAEKDIVSIGIREGPTDPFLENTAKMAAKRRGEKYEKQVHYEAIFRLTSSEAKRMREFANLNSGRTFALKLRTMTISMPTFLGTFLQGDEFSLVGVSEEDIERISKMVPLLIRDQRPNAGKK